eukprot:2466636-Pleurochrysis_carterae.AAC.1
MSSFMKNWKGSHGLLFTQHSEHDMKLPVMCTGHSLGGGVATLAALDLYSHGFKVYLVTFGSPRALNSAGEKLYEARGIPCMRFRNGRDVVTSIPLVNMRHVSDAICIGPERPLYYAASVGDHDMNAYERNVLSLFPTQSSKVP